MASYTLLLVLSVSNVEFNYNTFSSSINKIYYT